MASRPPEPDAWADERVIVVVAHPDDEVLACGALLARLRDVQVVHVTDGAPRDGVDAAQQGFARSADYAAARRAEALAGLRLAGVASGRLHGLGIPDQGAAQALVEITRRLLPLLEGAQVVLTHAYEGGHPDHDAVAFAVHAACELIGQGAPRLIEMPFYHGDETGWVRQRFLARPDCPEAVRQLSPAERALKARMVEAHATQRDTLATFELAVERFRGAPPYDFSLRPHDGPLLYERHGWNLTWPEWQARVREALAALGLAEA